MNKTITGLLLFAAVALGVYWFAHPENKRPQSKRSGESYAWNFKENEPDSYGTPHTEVSIVINGTARVIGTYLGSCREVPSGEKGVTGHDADPGEFSRAECWFAGGGSEIGLFEDGPRVLVRAGEIGESEDGGTPFRGNFTTVLEL